MNTDPVAAAAGRLAGASIPGARLEARLLWQHARQRSEAEGAPATATALFESLVNRRLAREPLAYITGHREFWSLDFAVGPGALIPRPDSETLVEQLCKAFPDRAAALSVLDLGTGTGCLLIAVLHEFPHAHGVGVDASPQALAWARQNIGRLGVEDRATLIESGWLEEAAPGFDAIVCNPPYIPAADIDGLEPDVRLYEPLAALDGGPDGLDAYRALAPRIGRLLAPRGRAFLEIGIGQEEAVRRIFEGEQLQVVAIAADLAGIPRCVVVERDTHGG